MVLQQLRRSKERSVLWLSLIFLIVSVAGVFLYDRSVGAEYRNERTYFYQKSHEKAFSTFILFTDQLKSFYRQLLIDREVTEWLNDPKELVSEMIRLRQIQNSFIETINSRSGIASVYLHNRKNNLVLSTSFMLAELPQFPNRRVFEQYDYDGAAGWQWRSLDQPAAANPNSRLISVVAGIPSRNKTGAVAINIEEKYVTDTLMEGSDFMLWLDENGKVLLSKNEEIASFYTKHAPQILNVKHSSFSFKNHLILSSDSEPGGWKLLTIVPEHVLASGRTSGAAYKYVVVLFTAGLGVLLLLYIRYRREQDKQIEVNIRRNLDDLRTGLVADLLSGKPVTPDLREKMEQYQMNLLGSGYQVVVFQIDDYYNYLLSKSNHERFFMNKIIFNAIKWTFALRFNAHVLNTELEKVAILLCYDNPDEDARTKLEETIRYIQNDIKDNSGLTMCVGVSEIVSDLAQVHDCHAHAMLALSYKTIYGKQAVIHYERLAFTGSSSRLRLSEDIRKINDYLAEGRIDRVELALESILAELIADERFTLDWIHAGFANILSTVMKFVIEHRIDIQQHFKEDVFITLYSYEFLEEKKAYILNICSFIVEQMRSKTKDVSSTAKQIIDYIDKHYDRPISLNILADKLSMSPSYLSVVIKNQLGIGFVEYISRLRIQKALKLLDDNGLTIQQISEQCGYDTVHTFIRQFKRAYHVPPNEYRTRIRMEARSE